MINDIVLCLLLQEQELPEGCEGYIVRNEEAFHIADWNKNIAKYVRKNHIQTDKNWMTQVITPNRLKI